MTRKHNQARSEADDEAFIIGGYNDGNYRHIRTDRTGGQAVALNTSLLTEGFEGTVLPAARWAAIATTMAATQTAASGLLINSGSITTINTGYLHKSLRSFQKPQRAPLHWKARARVAHVANAVAELGLGDASTFNGANANGAYWQYTSGGAVQPVLTYNGVDITGAAGGGPERGELLYLGHSDRRRRSRLHGAGHIDRPHYRRAFNQGSADAGQALRRDTAVRVPPALQHRRGPGLRAADGGFDASMSCSST